MDSKHKAVLSEQIITNQQSQESGNVDVYTVYSQLQGKAITFKDLEDGSQLLPFPINLIWCSALNMVFCLPYH